MDVIASRLPGIISPPRSKTSETALQQHHSHTSSKMWRGFLSVLLTIFEDWTSAVKMPQLKVCEQMIDASKELIISGNLSFLLKVIG